MEKLILVEKLNEDKVLISKEVPESLLSLYINTGWKVPEKKIVFKETVKSFDKKSKIIEEDND